MHTILLQKLKQFISTNIGQLLALYKLHLKIKHLRMRYHQHFNGFTFIGGGEGGVAAGLGEEIGAINFALTNICKDR